MRASLLLAFALIAGPAVAGENEDFWDLVEASLDSDNPDRPYTMVLVADPGARSRAEDARRMLLASEPFRRMGGQLNILIAEGASASMACAPHPTLERQARCDDTYVASVGAEYGAHQTIAVTSAAEGNSGGAIPVLGTGEYPIQVLLHELGHTYGLADEYEYTLPAEHAAFCSPPTAQANAVAIRPAAAGYRTDAAARSMHGGQIPWFGSIASSTLITTGFNLGTSPGVYPAETAGLFRGGNCNRVIPTWKPYAGNNVMNDVFAAGGSDVLPIHAAQIRLRIEAQLGRAITLVEPSGVAMPVPASAQGLVAPAPPVPTPPPAKNPTGSAIPGL